jgi:hypothetical protein
MVVDLPRSRTLVDLAADAHLSDMFRKATS